MSDLRELYQEVILDHSKRPRNFGVLEGARSAQGDNPLCGDRLEVFLELDADDRVAAVRFQGTGCAISTASASLMTEAVRGLSIAEVESLFECFHAAVTGEHDAPLDLERMGKLAVLTGVRQYPMRVKCASLAWHTLRAAIADETTPVTTE